MNLFTNGFRASLTTTLYIMGIYISTGAVGALQLWLRQHGLQRIVAASLLAIFAAMVVDTLCFRLKKRAVRDIVAVAVAGLVYAFLIKTYAKAPSDWIHLIEYPPLAVIAYYALKLKVRNWMALVYALSLTAAVGAGDEFAQRYVPGRTADVHDFIVNVLSCVVALAVVWFVIERKDKIIEG